MLYADAINDWWRKSNQKCSIREYLGMTEKEYNHWILKANT